MNQKKTAKVKNKKKKSFQTLFPSGKKNKNKEIDLTYQRNQSTQKRL